MSDLIEREDAVGAINGWLKLNHFPEFGDGILYLVPSADRPQGEWIDMGSYEVCKNCHEVKRFPHWTFCPNCGCRMKGADDE